MKVFVLGDDCETVILRVLPNRPVGRACQSYLNDVRAIRMCISELAGQAS
jgi:hypothetical protein